MRPLMFIIPWLANIEAILKDPRPTRKTLVAAGLVGPGSIEITATARK